jgi:hypothetical protein
MDYLGCRKELVCERPENETADERDLKVVGYFGGTLKREVLAVLPVLLGRFFRGCLFYTVGVVAVDILCTIVDF